MSECIKGLRHFFENCQVFIYERDCNGLMIIYEPKPFALKQEWKFDYCENDRHFCGTGMMDDMGAVVWKDEFVGGPLSIPPTGGSIECRYHKVSFGPYEAGTVFNNKKKGRRLRKLSQARINKLTKIYEEYGTINGWGTIKDRDGDDAIHICFEVADNLNHAPKYYDGWPVVCSVFGPIRLDSKKGKKND